MSEHDDEDITVDIGPDINPLWFWVGYFALVVIAILGVVGL